MIQALYKDLDTIMYEAVRIEPSIQKFSKTLVLSESQNLATKASLLQWSSLDIHVRYRPRVPKAFQNQDQDQAQVKLPLLWTFFETYYNYLTIDC